MAKQAMPRSKQPLTEVYLDIGSNIDRRKNIQSCVNQLCADFPGIRFSAAYESAAEGFDGDPFINLCAGLETGMSYEALRNYLKQLEDRHARKRNAEKFISRTLDVDILLFGDLVLQPDSDLPRAEILEYPFVLFPLAEIAAEFIHPVEGVKLAELAKQTELDKNSLRKIPGFPVIEQLNSKENAT